MSRILGLRYTLTELPSGHVVAHVELPQGHPLEATEPVDVEWFGIDPDLQSLAVGTCLRGWEHADLELRRLARLVRRAEGIDPDCGDCHGTGFERRVGEDGESAKDVCRCRDRARGRK